MTATNAVSRLIAQKRTVASFLSRSTCERAARLVLMDRGWINVGMNDSVERVSGCPAHRGGYSSAFHSDAGARFDINQSVEHPEKTGSSLFC
jgi:hypothetical protein